MSNKYTAYQVVKLIREELNTITSNGDEWKKKDLVDIVEWLDLNTRYVIEDDGEEDAE
jgi:hypothetical protein